jgi:uncharacterized membrane protein (TIGR02234 family)
VREPDDERSQEARLAMPGRAPFGAVLVLVLLGGAGALLTSGRGWQTVTAPRPRPFADEVVDVSGRTLEPAVAALGVVALAGVVAVLATRGLARRVVGGLLGCAAIGIGWAAAAGLQPVSASRARSLITDSHTGAGLDPTRPPQVAVHATWPILALICAVAVLIAGVAIAAWGHRWVGLSGRYEAPFRADRQGTSATLWTDLEQGYDPTNESHPSTPDNGR